MPRNPAVWASFPVVFILALAISGKEQDPARTGLEAHRYILIPVADDETRAQVEAKILCCAMKHPWRGLTTITGLAVGRQLAIRMVRAVVNGVQSGVKRASSSCSLVWISCTSASGK